MKLKLKQLHQSGANSGDSVSFDGQNWVPIDLGISTIQMDVGNLQTEVTDIVTSYWVQNVTATQTLNATPTTVASILLSDESVYLVQMAFVGKKDDSSVRFAAMQTAVVYRDAGGSATIGSAGVQDDFLDNGGSSWSVALTVSGNNLIGQVTGQAATTIDWKIVTKYIKIG